jgi:hypothetical protein
MNGMRTAILRLREATKGERALYIRNPGPSPKDSEIIF